MRKAHRYPSCRRSYSPAVAGAQLHCMRRRLAKRRETKPLRSFGMRGGRWIATVPQLKRGGLPLSKQGARFPTAVTRVSAREMNAGKRTPPASGPQQARRLRVHQRAQQPSQRPERAGSRRRNAPVQRGGGSCTAPRRRPLFQVQLQLLLLLQQRGVAVRLIPRRASK